MMSLALSFLVASLLKLPMITKRRTIVWSVIAATMPVFLHYNREPPLNRGAQKKSMAEMRQISDAIEAFRKKTGKFPIADSVSSLQHQLQSPLPQTDGWGTPFHVQCLSNQYTITCFGADGRRDAVTPSGAVIESTADIILENGKFISYPEGAD
jgi:hypothetical protein